MLSCSNFSFGFYLLYSKKEIKTTEDLLRSDPEELASKITINLYSQETPVYRIISAKYTRAIKMRVTINPPPSTHQKYVKYKFKKLLCVILFMIIV